MGLTDRERFAAEIAGILYAHEPCTDYDGCTCSHRTGYDGANPSGYSAWVVHVVTQFAYPGLANPPSDWYLEQLAQSKRGLMIAPDDTAPTTAEGSACRVDPCACKYPTVTDAEQDGGK